MAEDGPAFDDYPPNVPRMDQKRKYDDMSDHERKTGFSSGPPPASDRERRTGFSGPPAAADLDRKGGFSAVPDERKTNFSPAPKDFDRKTGFSGGDGERRTGFSGPPGNDRERRTNFSGPPLTGPPGGDHERKTGFSGPPADFERKSGFSSGPPSEQERKTGFSGPPGEQDRKTGFSGPPTESFNSGPGGGLSPIEIAKQKVAEIAARLVAQDSKRPRVDGLPEEPPSMPSVISQEPPSYGREEHGPGHMFQDRSQVPQQTESQGGNFYRMQEYPQSQKMDIPNARVGLIIGKGGETIKYLQNQSGARIQVTRDADHDPRIPNRQVEIMGTPDQISRAQQLIRDVIAEADAVGSGGGPMGGGFGGSGPGAEQMEIRVPNSKVGLIIGRGGDTIKNLQSKTGARIQLVPLQHSADMGPDSGLERIITLVGNKQQIEMANELIKEVISESRTRMPPGGYNQQGFRPPGPPQWGAPRAPMQPQGYNYQQQNSYSGVPQQYPGQPQSYGGYAQPTAAGSSQQFPAPSQSYGSYSQPSPVTGQQPQQTGPYNYYNQPLTGSSDSSTGYNQSQGSFGPQGSYPQQQMPGPQSTGMSTPAQQPYGQAYGQPVSTQQQSYGQPAPSQGYSQTNYGMQGVSQSGYGTTAPPQQASTQPGYTQQGPSPAYGQQGPVQSYSQQGSNQQLGYSQQSSSQPSYLQQEVPQTVYGQGAAVQAGYRPQGTPQQQVSIQSSYVQQDTSQQPYGQPGSTQPVYGQVQTYGQQESVLSGYPQQGTPTSGSYAAQVPLQQQQQQQQPPSVSPAYRSMQPGYTQQSTAQPTSGQPGSQETVAQQGYSQQAPVNNYGYQSGYATYSDGYTFDPQQGVQGSQQAYAQQGAQGAQQAYAQQGVQGAQPAYAPQTSQGAQPAYAAQSHYPSSSDATASAGNGTFDSSNVAAGLAQSAVQTAQS